MKVFKVTQTNPRFLGLYNCRPKDIEGNYLLENDYSGDYVPLTDYQAQAEEIAKLKGLLERWLDTQEITMTATFYSGMKEKYESVISDTEKALK